MAETKPVPGVDASGSIKQEVMIYFDWRDEEYFPLYPGVLTDGSCTYDVTSEKYLGNWYYTQFRIGEKGKIPEQVNLKLFLDSIRTAYSLSEDLWLGAVELGIMYYDQTAGWARVKKFDLVINGERVNSGQQLAE